MNARVKPSGQAAARWVDLLIAALVLASIVVSLFGVLGNLSWIFELLSHFRVQIFAAQLALLVMLAVRRRWVIAAILVPVAAANAGVLMPYWPQTNAALAAGPGLKVMTANVHVGNREHARFLELAMREDPDLILLLEVDRAWTRALAPLAARYPHTVSAPREDAFGIALLSRVPITDQHIVDLRGSPAIDAQITTAAGSALRFIGVHLRAPTSARRAASRDEQLAELAQIARQIDQPLIVAGDLNLTPYSPKFADLIEASKLSDTRAGRGWTFSWPTYLPILGIPIDHCLISEHFTVAEHYRGAGFGSDHYPILTQLFIEGRFP